MTTPAPSQPTPTRRSTDREAQLRAWLNLKRELAELHAHLEYVKLILRLDALRRRV